MSRAAEKSHSNAVKCETAQRPESLVSLSEVAASVKAATAGKLSNEKTEETSGSAEPGYVKDGTITSPNSASTAPGDVKPSGEASWSLLDDWNNGKWENIVKFVEKCPQEVSLSILDRNNKTTTLLHKTLTSKDIDLESRLSIVKAVLTKVPQLARVKNHHGSLPLHVAARNIGKLRSSDANECIIAALIQAFPDALTIGDAMGHTPLHVACEKWCTSGIANLLVRSAPSAASMKDKKGCLPIHIACSRRCSPKKAALLLDASPNSINCETNGGETPLSIAVSTSSDKNPQGALIRVLREALNASRCAPEKKRDGGHLENRECVGKKRRHTREMEPSQLSGQARYEKADNAVFIDLDDINRRRALTHQLEMHERSVPPMVRHFPFHASSLMPQGERISLAPPIFAVRHAPDHILQSRVLPLPSQIRRSGVHPFFHLPY